MGKRKSISKKIRFDIFKRDSFSCQYCGATPPNVVLEVDHITPVCSGGENNEDNLITSCFDCNRGKAGSQLSDVPKSLKIKAGEIKEQEEQIKAYNKILMGKSLRLKQELWDIISELESDENIDSYDKKRTASIKIFLNKLPFHDVIEAAEITNSRFNYITARAFRYFCAICWNKLKESG